MSPDAIPWLFCSILCLLPGAIAAAVHFGLRAFTARNPSLDVHESVDENGLKRTHAELVMLSREDRKARRHARREE